jgi:hypothetical protein
MDKHMSDIEILVGERIGNIRLKRGLSNEQLDLRANIITIFLGLQREP